MLKAIPAAFTIVVLVWLASGWAYDRYDGEAVGGAAASAPRQLPVLKPEDSRPNVVAPPAGSGSAPAAPATERDERRAVAAALERAVDRVDGLGGTAEVAVLAEGWEAPVVAGDARREVRMWSLSKPLAAVAALEAADDERPSDALREAMVHAISRSENCPQRRVVLGLQTLTGGSAEARAALLDVLSRAGVERARIATSAPPAEPRCQAYLQAAGVADPLAGALTLGTSRWTVADAARFAAALGAGEYGAAGREVLALMRRAKRPSGELSDPSEYTAAPDWGAGRVFRGLRPAYKAGWGGVQQGRFVAGQLAVVRLRGRMIAVAAYFHPATQPAIDDPGRTPAPRAIETLFRAARDAL